MSLYDAREIHAFKSQSDLQCEGPLCYDFSRLDDYINQPHVRKELGVGDRKWEACNMEVNFDMQGISLLQDHCKAHPPASKNACDFM